MWVCSVWHLPAHSGKVGIFHSGQGQFIGNATLLKCQNAHCLSLSINRTSGGQIDEGEVGDCTPISFSLTQKSKTWTKYMLTRGDRHCKSPSLSLKDHIDAFDAGSFPRNTSITGTIITILNAIDKQSESFITRQRVRRGQKQMANQWCQWGGRGDAGVTLKGNLEKTSCQSNTRSTLLLATRISRN